MSIEYKSGNYSNELIVTEGNTVVTIDITGEPTQNPVSLYYADSNESEHLVNVVDSICSDVKDPEDFRVRMIKEYFSDVVDMLKEEWEENDI